MRSVTTTYARTHSMQQLLKPGAYPPRRSYYPSSSSLSSSSRSPLIICCCPSSSSSSWLKLQLKLQWALRRCASAGLDALKRRERRRRAALHLPEDDGTGSRRPVTSFWVIRQGRKWPDPEVYYSVVYPNPDTGKAGRYIAAFLHKPHCLSSMPTSNTAAEHTEERDTVRHFYFETTSLWGIIVLFLSTSRYTPLHRAP